MIPFLALIPRGVWLGAGAAVILGFLYFGISHHAVVQEREREAARNAAAITQAMEARSDADAHAAAADDPSGELRREWGR